MRRGWRALGLAGVAKDRPLAHDGGCRTTPCPGGAGHAIGVPAAVLASALAAWLTDGRCEVRPGSTRLVATVLSDFLPAADTMMLCGHYRVATTSAGERNQHGQPNLGCGPPPPAHPRRRTSRS